jgi:hypothetical protein
MRKMQAATIQSHARTGAVPPRFALLMPVPSNPRAPAVVTLWSIDINLVQKAFSPFRAWFNENVIEKPPATLTQAQIASSAWC